MSQRSASRGFRELVSGRFVTINMKRRCTPSLAARGDGGEERVVPEERRRACADQYGVVERDASDLGRLYILLEHIITLFRGTPQWRREHREGPALNAARADRDGRVALHSWAVPSSSSW